MPVTNYYTVGNEIIGEKTTGSPRVDYLTDALGSVTATVNQSARIVNTYRHKPYGTQLAKTGVGADPAFLWNGTSGYRQTNNKFSDVYIRARHYSVDVGLWTAIDVAWPIQSAYIYVLDNPAVLIDPTGLQSMKPQPSPGNPKTPPVKRQPQGQPSKQPSDQRPPCGVYKCFVHGMGFCIVTHQFISTCRCGAWGHYAQPFPFGALRPNDGLLDHDEGFKPIPGKGGKIDEVVCVKVPSKDPDWEKRVCDCIDQWKKNSLFGHTLYVGCGNWIDFIFSCATDHDLPPHMFGPADGGLYGP